jgi:hypothetical protein
MDFRRSNFIDFSTNDDRGKASNCGNLRRDFDLGGGSDADFDALPYKITK